MNLVYVDSLKNSSLKKKEKGIKILELYKFFIMK